MVVVLIAAQDDPASINIKNALLEQSTWISKNTFDGHPVYQHHDQSELYLLTINKEKIYREHLDQEIHQALDITVDQLGFLSRHTSKTGKPTLTVHAIGNYGTADFGGNNHALVPSCPRLMTTILRKIYHYHKQHQTNYDVCYEVTHHGPFVSVPSFFVEIGSSEHQWNEKVVGKILAQSILDIMITHPYEHQQHTDTTVLVGIGGGHYAPRFSDIIKQQQAAFGHMIPTYQLKLGNFSKEILQQAIEKTPGITGIYIHKKALKKSQVTKITNLIDELGMNLVSSKTIPRL